MYLLLIGLFIGIVDSAKLPNYIVPCVRTKADFQKCAFDNGLKAIPSILKGDRKFKVPPLVPLNIPQVTIEPNDNLKITLNNLVVSGLDTVKLKDVLFDFDKNVIKVSLLFDYVTIIAQYDIDGTLVVPIRGTGPSNITLVDVGIDYMVDFDVEKRNGKDYLKVKKDNLILRGQKSYYELENLFGNKQLSDQTNKVLNDNYEDVTKILNGPVSETIRQIVTQLITSYMTDIPMDEIFLKE